MKRILIDESQMARLFEDDSDAVMLDGDNNVKQFGSEAATSPSAVLVHSKKDGEEKFPNPVDSDKIADEITPQNYTVNRTNRF